MTEREVVSRAIQRIPVIEAIEGAAAIERGRGLSASTYSNPQLNYVREQTFGALGTGEDYLSIAQVFDLGNRRGLHGEAGEVRSRAAHHRGESTQQLIAAEARTRFYEVLFRQQRVTALESWLLRIDEALKIVARREQRGDAAAYDRRRLERESAVAIGRLEVERASLERAHARLMALVGPTAGEGTARAAGALLPDNEPGELGALRVASASRPDLIELGLLEEAATLEQRAARRWWAPDLRLEGGWKGVAVPGQGRTDGFLAGASLALPLFDRSAGAARVAHGEALVARSRRALAAAELEGELSGARAEAVRLMRAAVEFRQKSSSASADLVRIASAGYTGGELGLLALLDAYRGAADDALSALELEHAARRARIELDRMSGAPLP